MPQLSSFATQDQDATPFHCLIFTFILVQLDEYKAETTDSYKEMGTTKGGGKLNCYINVNLTSLKWQPFTD